MMKYALVFLITLFLLACKAPIQIIDKPIMFNEQRQQLTKAYLKDRYGIDGDSITIQPQMIVIHWTAIETIEESFDAFYNVTLPSWRPDIKNASGLNVSAHFLVDRDGSIYRLMPENVMGRHVIGLNHCAIGIENVGGTVQWPLTKAQEKANIQLIRYLSQKYMIDYLIGHHEYTSFEEHPLWLEVDDGYRTVKTDPGEYFMKKIRKATKKFNFKPLPKKNNP